MNSLLSTPNEGVGPPKQGKHIVCYQCRELGNYANNCPNPQKEEDYTPYCGRCRKPSHIVEECRAPLPVFSPSKRDYPQGNQVQFQPNELDSSRNVHHVTQLKLPKSQEVYITWTIAKAKQALREYNQRSSSDSDFIRPQIKQKSPPPEKPSKKMVLKPPHNQLLIPPNIDTLKESTSIPPQEPPKPLKISQEPLKLPIQIKNQIL